MAEYINSKIEVVKVGDQVAMPIHKPKPLTIVLHTAGLGVCWWVRTSTYSCLIPAHEIKRIVEDNGEGTVIISFNENKKVALKMTMDDIFKEMQRFYEEN